MNKTSIEWTDRTWNPIRARLKGATHTKRSGTFCTRISPGCTNCYASTINRRFGTGMAYTVPNLAEHEFFIDERILAEPLKLRKPSKIFVGDMFDLFHEAIPSRLLTDVFTAAWEAWRRHGHTFQFLTKRADRMHAYLLTAGFACPGFWLGVSVEDQQRADERIPLLLQTLATVRFLSVEPLLEAIDLDDRRDWMTPVIGKPRNAPSIDWVICGGESGPGARPFNLQWAHNLRAQCLDAGVAFFMKQMGSFPVMSEEIWRRDFNPLSRAQVPIWLDAKLNTKHTPPAGTIAISFRDSKGGDQWEWPESLRVREFPASQKAEAVLA
jgi:protein gp37